MREVKKAMARKKGEKNAITVSGSKMVRKFLTLILIELDVFLFIFRLI